MGGVFINYRSVDDPLGAASIGDHLERRFGPTRVFRDCESLRAGEHYPTAIRAALKNADVVVAVIGPQWLTLTDPRTDVRLIDRQEDWVRWELATAFQRKIAVLPVLLKDTPGNARHPTPAELPEDIRALSVIQAFQISQRTLGADLESLAGELIRLCPALAPAGTLPLSDDVFYSLVNALEAVPCLLNEDTRALLASLLSPAIAGAVRYSPQRRIYAINIIRTCLDYEGGLAEVIATIRAIEGAESVPLQRLVALSQQLG